MHGAWTSTRNWYLTFTKSCVSIDIMYSLRLNKNCFGQGFDSPHLHQSILEFMVLEYTLGGCTGFDRAISSEVENTV